MPSFSRMRRDASFSTPTIKPIAITSYRGSKRRLLNTNSRRISANRICLRPKAGAVPHCARCASPIADAGVQCREVAPHRRHAGVPYSSGPSCSRSLARSARLLVNLVKPRRTAEVHLTLVDQGPDVLLKGVAAEGHGCTGTADYVCRAFETRPPQHRPRAWSRNPVRAGSRDRENFGRAGRISCWQLSAGHRGWTTSARSSSRGRS